MARRTGDAEGDDEVEEDEEGKKHVVTKSIPVFRYSTVFNIAQVDNAPEEESASGCKA